VLTVANLTFWRFVHGPLSRDEPKFSPCRDTAHGTLLIIPQTVTLTPDHIALNRAMFGATAKELERFGKTGWKAWIKEQIHPDDAIAKEGSKRIGSHCMRIKYEFETVKPPGTGTQTLSLRWKVPLLEFSDPKMKSLLSNPCRCSPEFDPQFVFPLSTRHCTTSIF
jgi:hypothetical protein